MSAVLQPSDYNVNNVASPNSGHATIYSKDVIYKQGAPYFLIKIDACNVNTNTQEDSLVFTTFAADIKPQEETAQLVARAKQSAILREKAARAAVLARINSYCSLEDGWDGHHSHSVNQETIAKASEIINSLDFNIVDLMELDNIYPTPNGTITVEHEFGDNYLVIDFGQSKILYYCKFNNKLKGLNKAVNYSPSVNKELHQLFAYCGLVKENISLQNA